MYLVTLASAEAKVKLPSVFSDGMVLQRERPVKIWGTADPDEDIVVTFKKKEYTVKAGIDGKWIATLPAMKAGGPFELVVNDVVVKDILVGDVWLCSGQSNMPAISIVPDPQKAPITYLFKEKEGYVSMEAEHYSRIGNGSSAHWIVIPNLGRTLSGVTTAPGTAIPDSSMNFTGGLLRLLFPFTMGMLLSRNFKPIKMRGSFWICTVLLIILFSVPYLEGTKPVCINGIYEAFCIIIAFPVLVWLGASGTTTDKRSTKICNFLGGISYPLYMIHYPFMWIEPFHFRVVTGLKY